MGYNQDASRTGYPSVYHAHWIMGRISLSLLVRFRIRTEHPYKGYRLFYRNLKLPDKPVKFVEAMKQNGFLYQVDTISEVARFYKEDLLEIEFLTKVIGSGSQSVYLIKGLGIKAEGLRIINMLDDYATEVMRNGYKITVPLPAAYVVQKLLANPTRVPASKKSKDIASVLNLLDHIKVSEKHRQDLNLVLSGLTEKQRAVLDKVVKENNIDLG